MKRKKGNKLLKFLIILTIIAFLITLVDMSMRLVAINKEMNDLYIKHHNLENKLNRIDERYATVFKKQQEQINEMSNISEIEKEDTHTYGDEESNWDWNLDTNTLWITTVLAGVGAFLTKGKLIKGF
ncbi:hypothetical protein P4571_08590 [Niallia alba]|uniref:hypothetical protein n=1 Tax=Niallia alba TaxID=2729105 RepID=UPI002E1A86EB|nr:hypothetical protein [Niallia alba]